MVVVGVGVVVGVEVEVVVVVVVVVVVGVGVEVVVGVEVGVVVEVGVDNKLMKPKGRTMKQRSMRCSTSESRGVITSVTLSSSCCGLFARYWMFSYSGSRSTSSTASRSNWRRSFDELFLSRVYEV